MVNHVTPELSPASKEMLAQVLGRIQDTDSHEMFPARLSEEEFGPETKPLVDYLIEVMPESAPNSFTVRDFEDTKPILKKDLESYWGAGCRAPGAYDMHRRLEVMDVAGINTSLVFGSMLAVLAQKFAIGGGAGYEARFGGAKAKFDHMEVSEASAFAYNNWCLRSFDISPRLRPVPLILTGDFEKALAEAKRVVAAGARAVMLPACQPIGGKSPAHPDNDPFWKLFEENNVAVIAHIGSETAFLRDSTGWANAPQFSSNEYPTELPIDSYFLATCSLGIQNYLTSIVLGGVFERFPNLRFGVMEIGGHWVGPTAENLDLWAHEFRRRLSGTLSLKPSEYIHRNVRVSPFHFEPVDQYIKRFPYLQDVYTFSTDYPHYEGGTSPIEVMAERMSPLGFDAFEKFFVTNADWIMPN